MNELSRILRTAFAIVLAPFFIVIVAIRAFFLLIDCTWTGNQDPLIIIDGYFKVRTTKKIIQIHAAITAGKEEI